MAKSQEPAQPNLATNLFLQVLNSTVWEKSGAEG